MYLPPDLARLSKAPQMRGLKAIGIDGNIRHDWFHYFRMQHPANMKTWEIEHLAGIFWEIELQQMHEGYFTVRYVMTALLNFHRKMAYWSNTDDVELLKANGRDKMIVVFLAEKLLHENLANALVRDGKSALDWPDSTGARRRYITRGEIGLAWEMAYFDKLDDVMRVNALEGAPFHLYLPESPRDLATVNDLGPILVRTPGTKIIPPREGAHPIARISAIRPTTIIQDREEYSIFYVDGEVEWR